MQFASLVEVASLAAIHKAMVMVKLQALQEQPNLELMEMSAAMMGWAPTCQHEGYVVSQNQRILKCFVENKMTGAIIE